MKKICCVIQRYGLEINGGAESLTRFYAERLASSFSVDVLTTKAIDYLSWKEEYEAEEEVINGVNVKRFPLFKKKNQERFFKLDSTFRSGLMTKYEHEEWLVEQGPFVPSLIEYLREHQNEYCAILLFTYLYYPSARAIAICPEKTIVIPFAHDEPYLTMSTYHDLFLKPKAFVFQTLEERELIRNKYKNYNIPSVLCGSGIEIPDNIDAQKYKDKYGISDYVTYVGRIDTGKNCEELFSYFIKYKEENKSDLKLVLMGSEFIKVPKHRDIISLGFVSEEEKYSVISGAKALVLPSKYESLSIVLLEALKLKVPVLVNGFCDVLRGQISRSGGGYIYNNYDEFKNRLQELTTNENINKELGESGYKFVNDNYDWDFIIKKLENIIHYVDGDKE